MDNHFTATVCDRAEPEKSFTALANAFAASAIVIAGFANHFSEPVGKEARLVNDFSVLAIKFAASAIEFTGLSIEFSTLGNQFSAFAKHFSAFQLGV